MREQGILLGLHEHLPGDMTYKRIENIMLRSLGKFSQNIDIVRERQEYLDRIKQGNGDYFAYVFEANLGVPGSPNPEFTFEVREAVREKGNKAKVVPMTGRCELSEQLCNVGMGVLSKPFSISELRELLED